MVVNRVRYEVTALDLRVTVTRIKNIAYSNLFEHAVSSLFVFENGGVGIMIMQFYETDVI